MEKQHHLWFNQNKILRDKLNKYVCKKNENRKKYPCKDYHIYNSPKLETTQMFMWVGKQIMTYPNNVMWSSKKKQGTIEILSNMNKSHRHFPK